MLLELAIGDAYGAAFEFVPQYMTNGHQIGPYQSHPTHHLGPGRYTDDTQMSIAVAELMLSKQAFTRENVANFFVNAFNRDPRKGYAKGFYQILQSVENGSQLIQRIISTSNKNGAAMRVAPIGIYELPEQVVDQATTQARVTHDSTEGISAAVAVALMVHYFHYNKGPKQHLPDYINGFVPGPWHQIWQSRVDVQGLSCVRAVMNIICTSDSMVQILERCIHFGGDTDTTAAIAMAIGSCSQQIDQNLPQYLFENLESGPYGVDYIRQLDEQLLSF